MSFINYSAREIHCKIVYYGPGLCGKTTNLQYIYRRVNPESRGEMISLATGTARTPLVLQYNKRAINSVSSVAELHALLNYRNVPEFEAVATTGVGVFETLKAIIKLVLIDLKRGDR